MASSDTKDRRQSIRISNIDKPGIVEFQDLPSVEERMEAIQRAEMQSRTRADVDDFMERDELMAIATKTPAQLVRFGDVGSIRGQGGASVAPTFHPSGKESRDAFDSDEDKDGKASGSSGKSPGNPPKRQGGKPLFSLSVAVENKPGVVAGMEDFADLDDLDSSEEEGLDLRPGNGRQRPRNARASVGSTGAEVMAEAIDKFSKAFTPGVADQAMVAEAALRNHELSRSRRALLAGGASIQEERGFADSMHSGELKDKPQQELKVGAAKVSGKRALQVAGQRVRASITVKKLKNKHPTCLLNKNSQLMRFWDVVMIVLLAFTALFTPFEVSFVTAESATALDTWFWVNRIVDLGFLVDLVFNFFLPYHDMESRREVIDHRLIALNYIKGWFSIDFLSILPFDIVFEQLGGSGDSATRLRIIRVIRLLKLAKLLRVVRASRIITRWRTRVGLSFSAVQLASFLMYVLLLTHWGACAFYLVSLVALDPDANPSWRSWIDVYDMVDRPYDAYISSLYFTTMTATTIGYGDIVPQNSTERLFVVLLMILGGALYAYVIGGITSLVANFDGATSEHRGNMDQLNRYTRELDLPQELRIQLREYFAQTLSIQRERYYSHLLTFMSPKLRGEVAMHRHGEWIRHVPFFNVKNHHERVGFVTAVATELEPAVFAKLERVMYAGQPISRMYIIQRGLATVQGRIVSRGHFFGEEAILTQARAISTVRALTFLDVFFLTKEALQRILESGDFAATKKKIRYAVIRMALRRELLKCAALARIQNGLFRIANGGVLAYAPDPSADAAIEAESSAMAASASKPGGRRRSSVKPDPELFRSVAEKRNAVGRPPTPPQDELLRLASDASFRRSVQAKTPGSKSSRLDVPFGQNGSDSFSSNSSDEQGQLHSSSSHAPTTFFSPVGAGNAPFSTPSSGLQKPAWGESDGEQDVTAQSEREPSVIAGLVAPESQSMPKESSSESRLSVEETSVPPQLQDSKAFSGDSKKSISAEQRAAFGEDARKLSAKMPVLAKSMSYGRIYDPSAQPAGEQTEEAPPAPDSRAHQDLLEKIFTRTVNVQADASATNLQVQQLQEDMKEMRGLLRDTTGAVRTAQIIALVSTLFGLAVLIAVLVKP
jgi:CRP-like cAMP-binding protein